MHENGICSMILAIVITVLLVLAYRMENLCSEILILYTTYKFEQNWREHRSCILHIPPHDCTVLGLLNHWLIQQTTLQN